MFTNSFNEEKYTTMRNEKGNSITITEMLEVQLWRTIM